MPWFKVDDGFHSHPKTLAAGDAALGLWVRLGSWCSNHRTNGVVPFEVARLMGKPGPLKRLVEVGLIDVMEDGYALHDFLKYNPSRAEVEAEREKTARRVAEYRARKNADGNGVSNGVGTGAPTRPDPTRPVLVVGREEEVQEVEVDDDWLTEHGVMSTSELPETSHPTTAFGDVEVVDGIDAGVVLSIVRRLSA